MLLFMNMQCYTLLCLWFMHFALMSLQTNSWIWLSLCLMTYYLILNELLKIEFHMVNVAW